VMHRLKTARLRGVYSQGLVLPLSDFQELANPCLYAEGNDWAIPGQPPYATLAEALGVEKFDDELPEEASGPFPTQLMRKSSSERAQNLDAKWATVLANGPWIATEKIDGFSCSVARDDLGELYVCGRNWRVRTPAEGDVPGIYWRAVRQYGLEQLIQPGMGVQFEIYGEGIRGNPLRVDGTRIAIFAAYVHGILQPRATPDRPTWRSWAQEHAAPLRDLQLPSSAAEAIAQVDGIKSAINPDRLAEGVVWHQANGFEIPEHGFRSTLKVLSNKYLSKEKG
jgi:RNA ligase (TIGR02306 family)